MDVKEGSRDSTAHASGQSTQVVARHSETRVGTSTGKPQESHSEMVEVPYESFEIDCKGEEVLGLAINDNVLLILTTDRLRTIDLHSTDLKPGVYSSLDENHALMTTTKSEPFVAGPLLWRGEWILALASAPTSGTVIKTIRTDVSANGVLNLGNADRWQRGQDLPLGIEWAPQKAWLLGDRMILAAREVIAVVDIQGGSEFSCTCRIVGRPEELAADRSRVCTNFDGFENWELVSRPGNAELPGLFVQGRTADDATVSGYLHLEDVINGNEMAQSPWMSFGPVTGDSILGAKDGVWQSVESTGRVCLRELDPADGQPLPHSEFFLDGGQVRAVAKLQHQQLYALQNMNNISIGGYSRIRQQAMAQVILPEEVAFNGRPLVVEPSCCVMMSINSKRRVSLHFVEVA